MSTLLRYSVIKQSSIRIIIGTQYFKFKILLRDLKKKIKIAVS